MRLARDELQKKGYTNLEMLTMLVENTSTVDVNGSIIW